MGPLEFAELLRTRVRLWAVPAAIVTLVTLLFVLLKPDHWEASQALTVRPEAIGAEAGQGKFGDLSEMKTVQETILELIKSRHVLEQTLRQVGPAPPSREGEGWPTDRDVAELRECVKVTPPKGAEFGKTEVFYLKVRDRERARAIALVDQLGAQLELRFQALRNEKARSLIAELSRAVALAKEQLDQATDELSAFEDRVGADLSELRILQASPSGTSDIRQNLVALENELRQYEAAVERNKEMFALLREAQRDPSRLVATPGSLLESQPALRRLKEGLVDAQLRTATLAGTMTEQHPLVRAAQQAEAQTRRHLFEELKVALEGVEVDLKLSSERVAALRSQLDEARSRLQRLAALRAPYANLVAATQQRARQLEEARRGLAEAQAAQSAAHSASLIARIDTVDGGTRPTGPSRATILAAGTTGGLLIGLGIVLLVAAPSAPEATPSATRAPQARPAAGATRPSTSGFRTPSPTRVAPPRTNRPPSARNGA